MDRDSTPGPTPNFVLVDSIVVTVVAREQWKRMYFASKTAFADPRKLGDINKLMQVMVQEVAPMILRSRVAT